MDEQITLLIVDDHHVVRRGIRGFLDAQPDLSVVSEASSGEEAIALAAEIAPDVLLIDLVMPGIGGVEVIQHVKQTSPHTQIIVLTSFEEDEHIFPALRAGALSYLLKDIKPDELVVAIRKAARGESILHPRVAARIVQELHNPKADVPDPLVELSNRELEILRLIADGFSNATIAGKLTISESTVKGHVSNILGKLHLMDRTQAAAFAWRQGLIQ